jgi:transcriptional regulator with XRE-family HTH domain
MSTRAASSELASFLRSRRARISPADAGLVPGPRRRTPGLRREEVAQLSGVGVTWYTWLEQGRPINASPQVLTSVARALRLDIAETEHLFRLAGVPAPRRSASGVPVPEAVQRVLDSLDPNPAHIVNERYDVLAWNRAALWLITDFASYPPEERNLVWLSFTQPWYRTCMLDWEEQTRRTVGLLRANAAGRTGEPAWAELIQRLRATGEEFTRMWDGQDVAAHDRRLKVIDHPDLGTLRLEVTPMWLAELPGWRMSVYTPMDETTRARLAVGGTIRGRRVPAPERLLTSAP